MNCDLGFRAVKFQGQNSKGRVGHLFRAFCFSVCALGLGLPSGAAHAQNESRAPIFAAKSDDLSLLPGPIIQTPPGGPKVQTAKPTSVWPWEISGEIPDPAIRFGRLENGMRYAIKR
ncbi:MAG: hypothetical protein RL230_1117, partial [Pseudomonadota bacterium]